MSSPICPLLTIAKEVYAPCAGEYCAWWDYLEKGCCLCAIASSLLPLQDSVDVNIQRPAGEEVVKK